MMTSLVVRQAQSMMNAVTHKNNTGVSDELDPQTLSFTQTHLTPQHFSLPALPGVSLSGVDSHDEKVYKRGSLHLQKRTIWRSSNTCLEVTLMERLLSDDGTGKMRPHGKWNIASTQTYSCSPSVYKGMLNSKISSQSHAKADSLQSFTVFEQAIQLLPSSVVEGLKLKTSKTRLAAISKLTSRSIIVYDLQLLVLHEKTAYVLSASLRDNTWAVEQRQYSLVSKTALPSARKEIR